MNIQSSGYLFELVQLLSLFPDSKTFPDAPACDKDENIQLAVDTLIREYARLLGELSSKPNEIEYVLGTARLLYELRCALQQVVTTHFNLPADHSQDITPHSGSMEDHIERMWDWLTRRPGDTPERSTLLPLNYPYVVPGGRYVELYYWDSYFTSVGLLAAGRTDLLHSMVDNITDLIKRNGFAPNGNRSYYATRSQPPYYCHMLRLLAKAKGEEVAKSYYDTLKREYIYWIEEGTHLIRFAEGSTLNTYWDHADTPRPEGYREDLNTWYEARSAKVQKAEKTRIFRDLRAAAESGWDFSSRWLKKDEKGKWPLSSIRTTSILPIDLNCLIYSMERQLARWAPDDDSCKDIFDASDKRRGLLLSPPFWNSDYGWFFDAEFDRDNNDRSTKDLTSTDVESIAGIFPLFCEVAGRVHADKVAEHIEARFLKEGGVVTSTQAFRTGQQWDYPNGWAPLQWVTVVGLVNYGYDELARKIAHRFVEQARRVYEHSGKMMEKYDVCDLTRPSGGGEYQNQDGFGWTNAVVKAFIEFLKGNVFWR